MKTLKYIFLLPLIITVFFNGTLAFAALAVDADFEAGKSLVPCGNDKHPLVYDPVTKIESGGEPVNRCNFNYVFVMLNRLLDFILKYLAVPIAAIMFAYAGILLLFAGGDSGAMSRAKGIFVGVAQGLIFIAAAWLIIKLVLSTLGYTGWNPFE